ncbi:hypothetical protein LAZ67_9002124 [Cordylochernes scorpioides]|uniref:Mos1 transposase HTH domain-containing protein n=1 Tax=Cordylochernes scorpioides TaxID=51811 RepID=A0ABY6KX85_9ARAC|nr:hypothetical protein LAZ67_9002124 [Cordylochernes scorpioides]
MNIANEMLDSVRDDPNLLQRVITGDEAWVYGYDVKTKAQSSQWKLPHEPRPKKARQVRSNVKVLLTVFFDCRGVVHHEFLPQGRMVNKEYYLQVMRNLREAIRQKRPDLLENRISKRQKSTFSTSAFFCAFHRGQKAAKAARAICNVNGKGVIGERAAQKWFSQKLGAWVPHELNETNKENRLQIAGQHLARHQSTRGHKQRFLYQRVLGDEKWCLYMNMKKRKEWLTPGDMPKPRIKQDFNPQKAMICIFLGLQRCAVLGNAGKEFHSQQGPLHCPIASRE